MLWFAVPIAIVSTALLIREKVRSSRSDGQYRTLVDTSPSSTVVMDTTKVLYANSRVISIVSDGDATTVIGRPIDDVLAPETARMAKDGAGRVLDSGKPFSLGDVLVEGRNGAAVRCDVFMVPATFDGSDAVQCSFHPVDEKHAAMRALHETEERFRRFFEDMPVPMYRTRLDGTVVHANTALRTMLAIEDGDDLVGTDASVFYAKPRERQRLAELQAADGLLEDQISELETVDGRSIWVRDSSHTIVDDGQEVFEGALVDVTAEYLSRRELEVRAIQQQALAHVAQVGLRSMDVGEVLQEAVDQVCNVVRADCAIVAQEQPDHGLLTTAVAYGVDSARHRERALACIQEQLARVQDADGRADIVFPASVTDFRGIVIALASPDQSYGVLAVAGEDLEISDQDLNYLRATAATLSSALLRSRWRAQLDHLMRSKDEFVASVSHELRTPLTVVAGLALELEHSWRSFSAEEHAEFISLIADQSREMGDLIEDLLVAARADIGKVPIYPEATDLRSCANQVIASCTRADRARMEIRGDGVVGYVDPVRYRQILRNLVTNAIRYGGPRIRVSVRRGESGALVSVSDDGQGIAEDDRVKIFSAYERAHTTSGVPGSVGLGLTVSRKLTELMGGSISYRYEGGSHFELLLPMADGVLTAD